MSGKLKAQRLALRDCLIDCFGAAEADGFQQHEEVAWREHGIVYQSYGDSWLTFTVDGREWRVQITAPRGVQLRDA